MKDIKIKEQKKDSKNWLLLGNTLSQIEFTAGINKAEKGPFHTIQESMGHFEQ